MPANVFFSYSHKDEKMRDRLATQLSMLQRQGLIETWHDRKMPVGDPLDFDIDVHLNAADITLLLLSPDFLASNYCYKIEKSRALERAQAGLTTLISVILRPCDWQHTDLARYVVTPKDGKPISLWSNRDKAFQDVADSIRYFVEGAGKFGVPQDEHKWLGPPAQKAGGRYNVHDARVVQSICQHMPDAQLEYVRNHRFPTPFHPTGLEGINWLCETGGGPRSRLKDPELDAALSGFRETAHKFLATMIEYTAANAAPPYHRMSNWDGLPHTLGVRIMALSIASTELVKAADRFFELAKDIGYAV